MIEIGAGECRLLQPLDDCFRELRNNPMPPALLMRRLAQAGINMIPTDAAVPYLSGVKLKDRGMESMLHSELCLVAPAFAVSWSMWNASRPARKVSPPRLLSSACLADVRGG